MTAVIKVYLNGRYFNWEILSRSGKTVVRSYTAYVTDKDAMRAAKKHAASIGFKSTPATEETTL